MDPKRLIVLVLQVSIIATVFALGLRAVLDDLLYVIHRPRLFVRSLLAVFVIVPIIALVLVRAFEFRPTVEVTLVALALSPVPPLLPGKESRFGGSVAFGLGLLAWLALLSILVIPGSLRLLAWLADRPLAIAPTSLATIVLKTVVVPLALGIVVRRWWPAIAASIARPVARIGTILLVPAAVALIVGTFPAISPLIGEGTLLAMVCFVVVGLVVGHVLGGPEPEHAIVLALSASTRHPAIAFAIAAANFPDQRIGGTLVLYLLVNAAVCIPYLQWQRRHAVQAAHGV